MMAEAQTPEKDDSTSANLSERAAKYREETEKIVCEVGEHPQFELKRSCSLQQLAEKIEFVKDIQSIATSRIDTEKFLVIGADADAQEFVPVKNASEFDEASVRQLLERYLVPVPDFEVFRLASSEDSLFVLIVIPKQKTRRILARVTVEDTNDPKPKVLLREGDLWTKGGSTGKRLAKPQDWDEIYEDVVEAETERRTRQRTAHALELAVAREKVQTVAGQPLFVPSFFTDEGFQALMEDICITQDAARLRLLLERLRDDLVEGWYKVGAYEESQGFFGNPAATLPQIRNLISDHIKNIFRPAMHWLTLAGLYVVKNSGPAAFLDSIVALLTEVFNTSHRLQGAQSLAPPGSTSPDAEKHVSHTVPALESLTSLYIVGAYLAKRNRFQYFQSLIRPDVSRAAPRLTETAYRQPMAFWPIRLGSGEPEELKYRAGKINYCVKRIEEDSAYLGLFGSESAATGALCQFELCLELNSFLACPSPDTAWSAEYIAKTFPGISFNFWPSLIAFRLEYIHALALTLFTEIRKQEFEILSLILLDSNLVMFFQRPGANLVFTHFLNGLATDQARLFMEQQRFPPMNFWPKQIGEAIKESREKKDLGSNINRSDHQPQ
jgi:hypothetical protein